MSDLVAHKLRAENRNSAHEDIKNKAKSLVESYMSANPLCKDTDLFDYYQEINIILEINFDTPLSFQLARQGFLEVIRIYNKNHKVYLDEPVVPVLAERDSLSIGYDWFVQGSKVSQASREIIEIWQRKIRFTTNDLVESAIFCSIVYGGLNDIEVLKAFYEWLLTERVVYRIDLPSEGNTVGVESVPIIILVINDNSYGCWESSSRNSSDTPDSELKRYVEYVPDDMTLCFLYALKDEIVKKGLTKSFDTLINDISKRLTLKNKDKTKPYLSHLIKYANYHWRQLEGTNIDNALATIRQGRIKTTGLPKNKLLNYNREKINSNVKQLQWDEFFELDYSKPINANRESISYPAFSKNLIRAIQEELKNTRVNAIEGMEQLQNEFPQPNAQRILGWVRQLLDDKSINQESISKYVGCIGRDWLMLTIGENIDKWDGEDFEIIYEQIIQSKTRDGRKKSVINKDSNFDDKLVGSNDRSYMNKLKDGQGFTYGRLRAFHDYQRECHDAPYVYFSWHHNRQVVKANIISPRIYRAMKVYIEESELEIKQERVCLVVLSLAYRTGLRVKELIGIRVSDIADIYTDNYNQEIDEPKIWIRPNRYRRLKSSSASRIIPINCLLKKDEMDLFIELFEHQKRLKRKYLFSQGSGKQPLPSTFFSNMMKLIWDRLLGEHDFTFHSFRHTAISQLTLVLGKSSLASIMTDYDAKQRETIIEGILGYHKTQGSWFGLASFAGHLTCDTTFEHYIHTAHLQTGIQLADAKLQLPYTVFQQITDLKYQTIHRQKRDAYDAGTKKVRLRLLRSYLVKSLVTSKNPLFVDSLNISINTPIIESNRLASQSIFIHQKYSDVIAYLEELQKLSLEKRDISLPEVAIRHGINIVEARQLYDNASQVFANNKKLLLSSPNGSKNQELLVRALEKAYQMSIHEPDQLKMFVEIFVAKQSLKTSSIHFGIKSNQKKMLEQFLEIGCKLINAQHWQIRASSENEVTQLKRCLKLDSQTRTGNRQNFHGYELRVVQKKTKRSDKNLAISETYYASSGVLKYLGYLLSVLIYIERC
ncbi:site-specific integrase [Psychrobacter submarinus]|uniref:site-specific integrase n=1 Tax=Psychrobacter submarinus TaxID=154108 RepID=UPI00191A0389|nr:site-specific integrase [Psychrobacter submarinus]